MLLLILLLLLPALTLGSELILQPENTRVMAMGGSFVALADDPQAGFLNPAGIGLQTSMGYDLHFTTATQRGTDFMTAAMVNPGTDRGSRFGTGIWAQGLVRQGECKWTVPYAGMAASPAGGLNLGMVFRFPVNSGGNDCPEVSRLAVADVSVLQNFGGYQLGAQIERAVGGAGDLIPRRLRAGTGYRHESGVAVAYEWRSDPLQQSWKFRHTSSHIGADLEVGNYAALRGGYIWDNVHRVTFGLAIGTLTEGWRVEAGWDAPTAGTGLTRWSAGLVYRYGKRGGR
ncbi:hypothetical protein HZB60_06820 [candidate division KSB1 bacterium]|nr:hypothetical protein [candidate division KSB1 bacterium]